MINDEIYKNTNTMRDILTAHGFKFSKSMGQNFLVDANIPKKIVQQSNVDSSCGVLEVGPGIGALTSELCNVAGHVTAIELDKRLVPILNNIFGDQENVSIIQGDVLKLDIGKTVEETMSGLSHHVCANLPYNITTPAITAFIDSGVFKSITVMVQREVALRMCAKPGTSDYGAFTVYANYHTTPEILFNVPPECFIPRPKVTSSIIRMEVRDTKLLSSESEKKFFRIVRAAFGQRRKTLVNALYAVFEKTHSKERIAEIVTACGFDVRIRGEVLSIDDFIKLSAMF